MLRKTMFIAISILLAASHVLTPATGQAKSGRFLLISDIHFDPFHDPSLFEKLADQPVERYGSTIQIAFAGHTHMDDFRIIRLDGKASLLMKIAPSVSPVFGNNPAYQIYDYDCNSGRLENYRTFFLTNLSTYPETGSTAVPNWDLEYDFQKVYKLPSLNAATVEKVANGIRTDGAIRKAYSDFYDVDGPSAFNAETVYGYSCAILNPTPAKYKACSNAANRVP